MITAPSFGLKNFQLCTTVLVTLCNGNIHKKKEAHMNAN